ncbi:MULTISPECIES: HNH endonuclease [unclassified Streptomyces]|uniref:HNH endonuclease n=1 Tax=unclassified Streptomyces TaxID=2593676 RepID=UPI00224E170C|nr:HNH endonuclease signature motif containing protein [Streptomyces sp. NBC_00338]MCX5140530.1 HNH endonuclease [Streptomyces sp. NBC_00338]WSU59066.1 HNH endonuclease [Streptomyces sp. NBC_01104]
MIPRQHYSRERLIEAAAQCADIDQVIEFLGTPPYGQLRRYLLRRFTHFDIDVSHFRHRGSDTVGTRPSSGTLRSAVVEASSIAELLRNLGRRDNEHQRKLLRQWITEEGIETSHFLGQAHQRGKKMVAQRKPSGEVLRKHDGKRRTRTVTLRRALLQVGVAERCAECGTAAVWHGQPITLEIDHISGDWSDDRAENLRLLCPNCHAITKTWCRGGARRSGA